MTISPRTLLQQALDALENSYLSDEHRNYELQAKAIAALREALAAPMQEPVTWKHDCAALCTNDVELWIDACPHCGKPRTAPPAAPAPVVPLTDAQLAKIAVEDEFLLYCDQDSFNEIARAIEAAHGITGASK